MAPHRLGGAGTAAQHGRHAGIGCLRVGVRARLHGERDPSFRWPGRAGGPFKTRSTPMGVTVSDPGWWLRQAPGSVLIGHGGWDPIDHLSCVDSDDRGPAAAGRAYDRTPDGTTRRAGRSGPRDRGPLGEPADRPATRVAPEHRGRGSAVRVTTQPARRRYRRGVRLLSGHDHPLPRPVAPHPAVGDPPGSRRTAHPRPDKRGARRRVRRPGRRTRRLPRAVLRQETRVRAERAGRRRPRRAGSRRG
jgi:hypothetical protein